MVIWLWLSALNLLALLAGAAFGPVYASAGRVRTWILRGLFLLAVALQLLHVTALPWFLVLWTSFGVGSRIRRRIAQPHHYVAGDGEG